MGKFTCFTVLICSVLGGDALLAQENPAAAPAAAQVQAAQTPPQDPKVIEDGGFSIEPLYWLNKQQPSIFGGKKSTADYQNYDYSGDAKYSLGGEMGIPAGRANTLRFSYFRVQGNGNATLAKDTTLFTEAYTAGDYVSGGYRLQAAKISWDYLSYTWHKHSEIRLKTLYELQYLNVKTDFAAPFKAVTTDASGNVNDNTASGSKSLIYPTLGMELESAIGKHFRWEVKASGFGLPHRAAIWDAQGDIGLRFGMVEVMVGERAYYFKTSPNADQYFTDTLDGVFGGVRVYWGGERQ